MKCRRKYEIARDGADFGVLFLLFARAGSAPATVTKLIHRISGSGAITGKGKFVVREES